MSGPINTDESRLRTIVVIEWTSADGLNGGSTWLSGEHTDDVVAACLPNKPGRTVTRWRVDERIPRAAITQAIRGDSLDLLGWPIEATTTPPKD